MTFTQWIDLNNNFQSTCLMKNHPPFSGKCLLLICVFINCLLYNAIAQNQITIKRNGYIGYLKIKYTTDSEEIKEYLNGKTDISINLPARALNIMIETGANLSDQSFFKFDVKMDGTIDSTTIRPKESAFTKSGALKILELNTKHIIIDPEKYKSYYQFSSLRDSTISNHPATKIKGKLSLYLVAGLKYSIDNGNNYDIKDSSFCENESCCDTTKKGFSIPSAFQFRVLANDSLQTYDKIATRVVHGNIVVFRTVCVSIDPKRISEGLPINYQDNTITTKRTLQLIPSLTTRLYWQVNGCRKNLFFVPM